MKKVTKKVMWIFAIGQLGWSILTGIVVNWLVYFYQPVDEMVEAGHSLYISQGTVVLGLFTIIGAITAFGRIFDAVTDPLIASASDRCRSKRGRRIPFLRAFALPFAVLTVLIFIPPTSGITTLNNVSLFIKVILFYLFMTLYCTPYTALIPELGQNQSDKINISTYISITFILGTSLAYGAPFIWDIFIAGGMDRMLAIRVTFGILAAIAFICMMVPAIFIKEKDYVDVKPSESGAYESLLKTFKNKYFRIFVLSDVFYWIALTIFQTGLPFFVVGLLGLDEYMIGILFMTMTLTSFLFYMPVNILAKKIGKKKMVVGAFLFFSVAFFVTSLSGIVDLPREFHGFLIAILAALPMAVLGILPQAIVADIAQYESVMTKENREGMFFAARTFAFKIGQSIAMVMFTSFATIGRDTGLGYRLALVAAIGFSLLGAIVLYFYDEKKIIDNIEK